MSAGFSSVSMVAVPSDGARKNSKLDSDLKQISAEIRKAQDIKSYYNQYLGFTEAFKEKFGDQGIREYEIFAKSNQSITFLILVMILCAGYFSTRYNLYNFWLQNPFFLISFVFTLLSLVISTMIALFRVVTFSENIMTSSRRLLELKNQILRLSVTRAGRALENLLVVVASIGVGLNGYGRVTTECSNLNELTMWNVQQCNPHGITAGIPIDYCLMQLSVVLLGQLFMKAVTREALLLGWISSFIMLNICLISVGSVEYPFIDIIFIIIMLCSYEAERLSITSFILKKIEIDTNRNLAIAINIATNLDHENELERNLNDELQANITNSAHDIRSPCCAVSLATDALLLNELQLKEKYPLRSTDANISMLKSIRHTISSILMIVDRTMVTL